MNKVKIFLAGAITVFVAIGIYSFRPLPDERLFQKEKRVRPVPTPVYGSTLPGSYISESASSVKALK
jgi:hypothetical protein